jgi:hypothetical protein
MHDTKPAAFLSTGDCVAFLHNQLRHYPKTADGLVTALEAAFRVGGVHLIAAPIGYSENTRVLIDELQSASLDR